MRLTGIKKLLSGAMVSISVFDTEDDSSILSSITNVGFSLYGKAPHCECGEQGSIPGVNHNKPGRKKMKI